VSRGDQLLRHWNLLRTLQTRGEGATLRDLADQFEVTQRTIQRDLENLQELGFPIDYEADEVGTRYWRMPHDFFRSGPMVLGLTEAVSLHLARHLFSPLAGTYFAEGLDSILDKIRSNLPAQALDHFADLDQTIQVRWTGHTDYSAKADILSVLGEAVRQQTTMEIAYRSLWRGRRYTTLFDPYGLVFYDGDLFLVGHSHRAKAVRIFKIARVLSAAATDTTFKKPRDYRIEKLFRSSFGIMQSSGSPLEVAVRFKGAAAELVAERVWHESQKLTWEDTGETLFAADDDEPEALVAKFRLANLVEFKRWIRGFGDRAEVLRPESLRREMRAELLAAMRQYE
jgi:predicted DNA-binding transcriptional regulator YafY